MTPAMIAELFQTTAQNITLHIKAIYREDELQDGATCKKNFKVKIKGKREISRARKFYNLPIIMSVGYRVRS
jgi:hypothetical protein